MGKSRKSKEKWSAYDEIRKPIPKPGFAFKSKRRRFGEDELDSEIDAELDDVARKAIRRLKDGND